ncbi:MULTISPECIES: hypothetical protein [Vibrio]|uniref:Type 4 fimbrial biogenesis protein PilX N-terminal domain-containing protein n=1 Tax=Vibrio casei TaxID=673372 RepID=A0A368LPP4_9VIBR|nr:MULTISPECIES: hypothetical protein [Vibrio]RCS73785.1 hypothetical protein CIK83_09340 [Vibrio casei]SJN34965.1 hypothetical protein FM109_13030 [Vibrio casei]HBV77318.1 hypothetical protein [Vibrio sp.]
MFEPSIYFSPNQKQQGAATLLVATLLLVVALVITLASYKGVFFQAKRVQNEIEARQLHWKGEGRLECVLAKLVDVSSNDPNSVSYNDCDQPTNIQITRQGSSNLYTVESNENGYQVAKVLRIPGAGTLGAITSTADLFMIGSFDIKPQPVQLISTPDLYSCVAVKYSKNIYLNATSNLQTTIPTSPDFPSTTRCASSYQTSISNPSSVLKLSEENNQLDEDGTQLLSENNFKGDFYYDSDLDPFEDLFGVPKSELSSVKKEFTVITGGFCSGSVCPCDSNIASAIEQNKSLIWVDGTCDFGHATQTLSKDTSAGIIVVVQNGLLGSTGSVPFNGVLYHLNTAFTPSLSLWSNMAESSWVASYYTASMQSSGIPVPSLFMTGAKVPDGVLIVDTPGSLAMIYASMDVAYDGKKINHALSKLYKPKWLKGSWHDF